MEWGPWALGINQFVCFSCKYFSGFKSHLDHLLALWPWPWASDATSCALVSSSVKWRYNRFASRAVVGMDEVPIISLHTRLECALWAISYFCYH